MIAHFVSRSRSFMQDECGAVTVDWVVLTAATVGLGLASANAVRVGVGNLGNDVSASLGSASVASLSELGSGLTGGQYQLLLLGRPVNNGAGYDSVASFVAGISDDDLLLGYANAFSEQNSMVPYYLQEWANSGDGNYVYDAAGEIDMYFIMSQEIAARGLTPPETHHSLQSLTEMFHAAVPDWQDWP